MRFKISKKTAKYSVRLIVKENWQEFFYKHLIEDYQKKEIEKMLNCSKSSCNPRICSSCGKRYTDNWSKKLVHFLHKTQHKHIVLTVPSNLRFILEDFEKPQ
ncbi:hypothetical protein GF327_06290 [Candidatus Woesearchaeota archaeon]|nr:hypothetical protein [Candidatus Woesearchaeota archaeon]